MAEMVKVVMMNQSSVEPIPIQYNSAILHVLEAYQELREELEKQGIVTQQLRESHAKDIEDFEELARTWERREKNYKNELKLLEVQLSKLPDGMEKVSLSRTRSTIHGTVKASDTIGRAVAAIKEKNSVQIPRYRGEQSCCWVDVATDLKQTSRRAPQATTWLRVRIHVRGIINEKEL